MPRLVTFDVVNTILRLSRSAPEHYARAATLSGLTATEEQIRVVYKDMWQKHKTQHPLYGAYQGMTSEQFWRGFVHRIFNELGHAENYNAVDKAADILITEFNQDPEAYDYLPNAVSVLESIKAANIKLGVISNFDERLTDTLRNKKLMHYFDFNVTCIDAMAEKPDSRIFEFALRIAGIPARETVHIGDDVDRDFFAARRVGMKAILLNTNRELTKEQLRDVPKEFVVESLSEIPSLLKKL